MTTLTKENFETEIEKCDCLAVIDLYADWCGPCKLLEPKFEELESEYPEVKFCRINVDEQRELTAMFKTESIPYVALVKDNTFLDFTLGYDVTTKSKLAALIEQYK